MDELDFGTLNGWMDEVPAVDMPELVDVPEIEAIPPVEEIDNAGLLEEVSQEPVIDLKEVKDQFEKGPDSFKAWASSLDDSTKKAVFSALQMGAGAAMKGLAAKNESDDRKELENQRREDKMRRSQVADRSALYAPKVSAGILASRRG